MNKEEAKKAMGNGKKVCHEYYSRHEYIFLNEDGKIQSEEGVIHGTFMDEFWQLRQVWDWGWSIFKKE